MPDVSRTHVQFADSSIEEVGPKGSVVLEPSGWVTIVDSITSAQTGGYLQRSRSYPPSAIRLVVRTRPEED